MNHAIQSRDNEITDAGARCLIELGEICTMGITEEGNYSL